MDLVLAAVAVAIVVGTFAVLVWSAWDLRDGYRSLDGRLARRAARRARRAGDRGSRDR